MKRTFSLFGVLVLFGLGFIGYKTWTYYQDTYVGKTYYARIAQNVPYQAIKDADGKVFDNGYSFKIPAYDTQGQKKIAEFTVYQKENPYPVGTFLKITASKKRVIEQTKISGREVPRNARKYILNP